jgi:hypothetical protein
MKTGSIVPSNKTVVVTYTDSVGTQLCNTRSYMGKITDVRYVDAKNSKAKGFTNGELAHMRLSDGQYRQFYTGRITGIRPATLAERIKAIFGR